MKSLSQCPKHNYLTLRKTSALFDMTPRPEGRGFFLLLTPYFRVHLAGATGMSSPDYS